MLTGYLSRERSRLHGSHLCFLIWLFSAYGWENASCTSSESEGEYDLLRKWIGLIYQNAKNLQIKYFLKPTESDFPFSSKEAHGFNLQSKHPLSLPPSWQLNASLEWSCGHCSTVSSSFFSRKIFSRLQINSDSYLESPRNHSISLALRVPVSWHKSRVWKGKLSPKHVIQSM